MYTQDKITRCSEITKAELFTKDGAPFYLFIVPRAENVDAVTIITARLIYEDKNIVVPLVAGTWNPVVFRAAEISSDMLQNYRVFWGQEG